MGLSIGRFMGNSFFKLLFTGIVILACVAGGIYVGDAFVHRSPKVNGTAGFAPALAMGDIFPLVSYTDMSGQAGSFESLLMEHKTIVLFLSAKCGRCEDLLDIWNREIAPILDSEVQTVVCLNDSAITPDLLRLIGHKAIVVPEKGLYQMIGLKVIPTIIGLDEYGLVVYIQPGYAEVFGRDFYEHFAMTAK